MALYLYIKNNIWFGMLRGPVFGEKLKKLKIIVKIFCKNIWETTWKFFKNNIKMDEISKKKI